MENDKEKQIEQFGAIAGVDAERSRFFLESSGWSIETALESFYEEADDGVVVSQPAVETPPSKPTAQGPSMPKVISSDESSSDEEGQAFYAGGSLTSGQQVLGPRRSKDMVSKLFKSAKEHGAEVMEGKDAGGKGKSRKNTFGGTGYKLGETEDDHQAIQGPSSDEPARDVILRMWKNGFTVDDGLLRGYEDPANHEFLNSVRRGQIPLELIKNAKGGEVYINMEDHRQEEFMAPKQKLKAFRGAGNTLGSLVPGVIGQVMDTGMPGGASGSTRIPATPENPVNNEQKAKDQLKVDSSQPTTNIQIRLPDGGRLILKVNHSHTVGDLRQYAITARPSLPQRFALMTTFPYVELKEDTQTITDAKLLNSAIVIK